MEKEMSTEIKFTAKDLDEYDREVLARQQRFARVASAMAVPYRWHPPELSADGSLADVEGAKKDADGISSAPVRSQWPGTKPGGAGDGTSKRGNW